MAGYVMKFLWRDPWIEYGIEDWDQGLVNGGLQTFRHKPPHPDEELLDDDSPLPPLPAETPENGFIEVVIPLEASDFAGAKLEAWRHWQVRPYGDEAGGYVILDTLSNETVHGYIPGTAPDGLAESPEERHAGRRVSSPDASQGRSGSA